ncbi:DUF1489 family protein [Sphingomonas nostoxanthinifaciens]|uniref:DUF1489 family protein n=1 Tax=Sphingomonas nostoxanthinifaciens TaxID=2872652 RepID=UPI001CC20716|nr:DUF1489 domain-containing protein [Sphingomonas nostoxanthinifaciens]UAK24664.1 DUF1489 domain-containing protein [Sphingomonas nostoxanthinifaciens]
MALHLTKVAFGCDDIDVLRGRLEGRAVDGGTWINTRYKPTRAAELEGGSLFWILKHQLIARSPILGFGEAEGRCLIRLDPRVVPVRLRPKRAHQGWRYLVEADAPPDLDGAVDDLAALPPALVSALAGLYLV